MSTNSFDARSTLDVAGREVEIAITSPNSGGYRFERLPAGLVRLVARHRLAAG